MAELSVRIGREHLSVLYHVLDGFIRPIGRSMIHIDSFKLYVERRNVSGVKSNYFLTNFLHFGDFL